MDRLGSMVDKDSESREQPTLERAESVHDLCPDCCERVASWVSQTETAVSPNVPPSAPSSAHPSPGTVPNPTVNENSNPGGTTDGSYFGPQPQPNQPVNPLAGGNNTHPLFNNANPFSAPGAIEHVGATNTQTNTGIQAPVPVGKWESVKEKVDSIPVLRRAANGLRRSIDVFKDQGEMDEAEVRRGARRNRRRIAKEFGVEGPSEPPQEQSAVVDPPELPPGLISPPSPVERERRQPGTMKKFFGTFRRRRDRAAVTADDSQVLDSSQVPTSHQVVDETPQVDLYASLRVRLPDNFIPPPVHGGYQAREEMWAAREKELEEDRARGRALLAGDVENISGGLGNRKENNDEPGSAPSTGTVLLEDNTTQERVLPEVGPKIMTETITPIKTVQKAEEA